MADIKSIFQIISQTKVLWCGDILLKVYDMMPNRRSRSSGTPSTDRPIDGAWKLPQDEIFHILQTSRRRAVIDYLLDKEGPVKMADIAEQVAANEHETTVEALTTTQRQRVYVPLYQSHLPKLDENGVIDYDKPRGIVRPTDRLEIFRPYLEVSTDTDEGDQQETGPDRSLVTRVTSDQYVTAISASVSLLAASLVGVLPISELALAAIITTLFVLVTVTTRFDSRSVSDSGDDHPVH